jgi:hypothetical protein
MKFCVKAGATAAKKLRAKLLKSREHRRQLD